MNAQKNCMKACTYRPAPFLLNKLNKMTEKMEILQRALEVYLETKRHIFPRFYFISNDDLLEILGNAKKPELVQPHLKKLFDNLVKLKLNKVCLGSFRTQRPNLFLLWPLYLCSIQYQEVRLLIKLKSSVVSLLLAQASKKNR